MGPSLFILKGKRSPESRAEKKRYALPCLPSSEDDSQDLIGRAISYLDQVLPGLDRKDWRCVAGKKPGIPPFLRAGPRDWLLPLTQGSNCLLQRWPLFLPSHLFFCNATLSLLHQENQLNPFLWNLY